MSLAYIYPVVFAIVNVLSPLSKKFALYTLVLNVSASSGTRWYWFCVVSGDPILGIYTLAHLIDQPFWHRCTPLTGISYSGDEKPPTSRHGPISRHFSANPIVIKGERSPPQAKGDTYQQYKTYTVYPHYLQKIITRK